MSGNNGFHSPTSRRDYWIYKGMIIAAVLALTGTLYKGGQSVMTEVSELKTTLARIEERQISMQDAVDDLDERTKHLERYRPWRWQPDAGREY